MEIRPLDESKSAAVKVATPLVTPSAAASAILPAEMPVIPEPSPTRVVAVIVPTTSRAEEGLVVPIPTLPVGIKTFPVFIRSDWFATVGKSPEEKEKVLAERKAQRVKKRAEKEAEKLKKQAGKDTKKMGKQADKKTKKAEKQIGYKYNKK